MDEAVQAYIDAIPDKHRPLFDRLQSLIFAVRPDADVVLSYAMPTYKAGDRGIHLAVWKHGVSIYGWATDRNADFLDRHPELKASKETIRITPVAAEALSDDELLDLLHGALDA